MRAHIKEPSVSRRNTAVMMTVVYLARCYLLVSINIFGLVILALMGGISYLLISLVFEKYLNYQVYGSFKDSIATFFNFKAK